MEIRIMKSYEEISQAAAKLIIDQVRNNPQSVLGLATGSSPLGIYQALIEDHRKFKTSYKDVLTFNLDEYFGIDKTHPQSYYHFMQHNLFQHIDVNPHHLHIPSGDTNDIDLECEAYNKKLAIHPIDIQILGIGSNGHIGFNEPGTSFDSTTHHIELDERTREDNARFFKSLEDVPTHAVTMGIRNILDAKKIILVATGKTKAHAVSCMVNGPIDSSCPASSLQRHDNVIVFLDQEAASLLENSKGE
jgi:glucosamine-6-phosphate deaminase